jgi:RIO-like serine/threonine protein kinase
VAKYAYLQGLDQAMTGQLISDNGISRTWQVTDPNGKKWLYKQQPKFLCDNEIWILQKLYPSGYVPFAEQVEMEVIRLEWIENGPVTDVDIFKWHMTRLLHMLKYAGIRHGDLTEKNVLVKNNHPFLIDFSESRLACDPRPDKRPQGDEYWIAVTIERLCE